MYMLPEILLLTFWGWSCDSSICTFITVHILTLNYIIFAAFRHFSLNTMSKELFPLNTRSLHFSGCETFHMDGLEQTCPYHGSGGKSRPWLVKGGSFPGTQTTSFFLFPHILCVEGSKPIMGLHLHDLIWPQWLPTWPSMTFLPKGHHIDKAAINWVVWVTQTI